MLRQHCTETSYFQIAGLFRLCSWAQISNHALWVFSEIFGWIWNFLNALNRVKSCSELWLIINHSGYGYGFAPFWMPLTSLPSVCPSVYPLDILFARTTTTTTNQSTNYRVGQTKNRRWISIFTRWFIIRMPSTSSGGGGWCHYSS